MVVEAPRKVISIWFVTEAWIQYDQLLLRVSFYSAQLVEFQYNISIKYKSARVVLKKEWGEEM